MNNQMELVQKVGAVVLPNLGGIIGGFLCPPDDWYKGLQKSKFNPPSWVFAPAWTYLYSSMGYASYLVWQSGGGFGGEAKLPLMLYGGQLLLNWAWSPLFFHFHNIKASVIDMSMLLPTVAGCALAFYKVNKTAGYLMVPYVLWLSFASFLNFQTYQLNKNRKTIKDTQ